MHSRQEIAKLEQDIIKNIGKAKLNHNFFCSKFLKIIDKKGIIKPLCMNSIQSKIQYQINNLQTRQLVILKARQFGVSTLIASNIFRDCLFSKGKRGYILGHEMKASTNIFNMIKRFYDNLPEFVKMIYEKEYSNEKVLKFKGQDSHIKVGTAGNTSEGRSTTNNYIHLSEAAFYSNMENLISGPLQTVADVPGNYIIFESTANGFNHFRDMFEEGLTKNAKVKSLFYGWQDFDEYRRPVEDKKEFRLTAEETELRKAFNLDDEQINWRRSKLLDFRERPELFKQEYPTCWQEAFLNSADTPLIPVEYVYKAVNTNKESLLDDYSPVVVGIDPARTGDRTVMTVRKGRVILAIYILTNKSINEIEGFIINTILPHNPDKIFIDAAYGLDIAKQLERTADIEAIYFGASPIMKLLYANRRSEMHALTREWFMQDGGVSIPNNTEVIREICAIPDMRVDVDGKFHMLSKDEIRKNLKTNSPDIMDSLVLTFAKPVKNRRRLNGGREVVIEKN